MTKSVGKRIFIIFVAVLFTLLAISPSLAWLAEIIETHFPQVDASTLGSYFESGNGSPETPYVITNPVHLYNLAWLQYIGYFNMGEINNRRAQSYFKLGDNVTQIDMTGWELPPIGTTQYPFIGNFDGNGASIVNLTTTNDQNLISKKPSNAKFLAVNDLLSVFVKENASGADQEAGAVIGFFGVVGDFGNHLANLNGQGVTVSTATPPQNKDDNTVYQQEIAVNNFGLYNYTLHNNSSQTLVGFVAGYANAPITNVQVGNGTLQTETTFASYQPVALTSAISDYLLVGYATEEYRTQIDTGLVTAYVPTTSERERHTATGDNGEATGWGGSIAMDKMFTDVRSQIGSNRQRISNYLSYQKSIVATNGTRIDGYETEYKNNSLYRSNLGSRSVEILGNTSTVNISDYYNVITSSSSTSTSWLLITGGYRQVDRICTLGTEQVDAFYLSRNNKYYNLSSNGSSVVGSRDNSATTKWAKDSNDRWYAVENNIVYLFTDIFPEYYISSGNNYLSWTSGTNVTNATSQGNATVWTFSNEDLSGQIYTTDNNGTKQYLRYNSGLKVGTSSTNWTNAGNKLYYTRLWNSYYIYLNGDQWATTSSSNTATTITFTPVQPTLTAAGTMTEATIEETEEYLVFNNNNSTYIPLQMKMNGNTCLYVPADGNTGYITSGSVCHENSEASSMDLRISEYSRSENLPDNGNNESKKIRIINGNAKLNATTGKYTYDEIDISSNNPTTIQNAATNLNLKKFVDCYRSYVTIIGQSQLRGLHFMRGRINADSLVTIPKAVVNGEMFINYQVPADCIDFSLKEKGHINFFAGTYYNYSGIPNNYFFTLHHIYRYDDATDLLTYNKIKEIKEISEIYEHETNSTLHCYYKYTDGSIATYENGKYVTKTSIPSDYELTFEMTWLTDPQGAPEGTNDTYGWTKRAYYCEVPASPGEYALGSSYEEGKNGAYLLYLDISANAQDVYRTVIWDVVEQIQNSYDTVDGVYFSQSAESVIDENERASALIQAGYSGTINASRQEDTITITHTNDNASNVQAGVAYGGVEFERKTESTTATPFDGTPKSHVGFVEKRVTYVDENMASKQTTVTVVTRRHYDDNTVVISGTVTVDGTLDQELTDELIKNGSNNDVTYLKTTKKDDVITWSEVTYSTNNVALRYHYDVFSNGADTTPIEITNDVTFAYTPGETTPDERYVVTVTSSAGITIEITTLGDIPAYFNGSETPVEANGTVEVSPS